MSETPSMGPEDSGVSMGRDPRKCTARRSDGELCGKFAMAGQRVCMKHGGASPQARAAAEVRLLEGEARTLFEKVVPEVVSVDNPLETYKQFAGRVMAWLDLMERLLADLDSPRYRGATAEQIRGEVVLYERAMDRANTVLGTYAKLNIDERLARISEQQGSMIYNAVMTALRVAGLSPEQQDRVRPEIARQMRALISAERQVRDAG